MEIPIPANIQEAAVRTAPVLTLLMSDKTMMLCFDDDRIQTFFKSNGISETAITQYRADYKLLEEFVDKVTPTLADAHNAMLAEWRRDKKDGGEESKYTTEQNRTFELVDALSEAADRDRHQGAPSDPLGILSGVIAQHQEAPSDLLDMINVFCEGAAQLDITVKVKEGLLFGCRLLVADLCNQFGC